VIRVDFTTDRAAWINLIFRLADFFIVSLLFDFTIKERRRCTLDLSVVGTIYFEIGFLQSKKILLSEKTSFRKRMHPFAPALPPKGGGAYDSSVLPGKPGPGSTALSHRFPKLPRHFSGLR